MMTSKHSRNGSRVAQGIWALAALAVACSSAADAGPGGGAGAGGASAAGAPAGIAGGPAAGSSVGGAASGGAASGGGGLAGASGAGFAGANAGSAGLVVGGAGTSGGVGVGGSAGSVAAGGASPLSPRLVPASGALLGQYYGNGTLAQSTARLGRTLAVHLVYYAWTDNWTTGATNEDLDAGRIPLVNWEPDGIDFANIVNGSLDATIKARATGAKALGKPFFLDFAAEMNGDEAWSGNDAKLYVAAYKHIHDLFTAAGARNVVWAWCPNVTDTNGSNKTTLEYYPGDDYVDWTGVDGYNWGGGDWQTFKQVFKDIYPLLASKKKPILIGEMSSSETGGDKAAWIAGMIPSLKTDYPLIKGVVWFDVNKERDWRVDSSTSTLTAFKAMAGDPFFNP